MLKKMLSLLFFIVIFLLNSYCVFSKPLGKTIKVPDYDMGGFIYTDDIGVRAGYSYEILQEIAKYSDWNYEYVKCDRSQCIDMLKNGELDIIDTCVYTEDRTQEIDYSNISAGSGYKAVIVKNDNMNFSPNDFKNYDGIKIGIVNESFWEESINKIILEKNFNPQIIKFNSYSEKFEALKNDTVDAVLTMSIQKTPDYKILFEFDPTTYYFAVKKGNSKLINELNEAMENIWLSDSTYFSKIYNKYYEKNSNNVLFLTDSEKEYLKQHNTIKASASDNRPPLSYFNEYGNYEGIVADITNLIASKIGFKIEFEKPENYKDNFKKIRDGKLDIICNFFYDYSWAEKNGIKMTSPYIDILQYNAITNKNMANNQENIRVAYVDNYFFNEKFLFTRFNKEQLILYDTEEECIRAVNNGTADVTYISNYIAEKIVRDNNYYEITMTPFPEFQHSICIGVGKDADIRLLTILNKAVNSIDPKEITSVINKHTTFQKENIDFFTFFERHILSFICVFLFFIIICMGIALYIFKIKKNYNETIFNLAYVDKVTGIWNINRFISEAENKIVENDFKKEKMAIISFDVSKFRVVNEHYGRFVGDRVLKYISENLNKIFYNGISARVNMDNFVTMVSFSEKSEVMTYLKNFRNKTKYYEEGGVALKLNFQCGVYLITDKRVNIDDAFDMAQIARKEAKNSRSDKVVFFDKKMEDKIIKYKQIEEQMETALQEKEFVVYYQPKVDIKTEKFVGAEALVRWISKEKGFMNPEEFIPVFEKEGFIIELDFYVLEEVFKIIKEWIDNKKTPITISVNQSRVHLSNPYYIERLENLINKYKVPTKYIELELTESLFMDADTALETVNKIKKLGFSVSVDDFGSGYSSLNMLKSMPIDVVKIDKEFLNESENSEKAQKIISKIVEMAKELNMNIICEGVEKPEQADFLKSIGCYYAQGFLYAKPMSETEFRNKVRNVIEKK